MTLDGMPTINIIQATLADLDETAELFDAYRTFYGQAPDLPAARGFLVARFEHNESVVLLARSGEDAVGFVQLYPSYSSVSMRRIWILNDLYVADSARRGGVASALLTAACEYGEATGAVRLELATANDNRAAQTLYRENQWQFEKAFVHFQRVL